MTRPLQSNLVFLFLSTLGLALPMTGCDLFGENSEENETEDPADEENDEANDEENETEDEDTQAGEGICAAATATGDACEAQLGEDVEACAPFDAIDEACEADLIDEDDGCELAAKLDDICEGLFGDDAEACAALDAIDEACEPSADPSQQDREDRDIGEHVGDVDREHAASANP